MTTQTRREFLGKLGWMFAGGILVPYIPKTFYSIPEPIIAPYFDPLSFRVYWNNGRSAAFVSEAILEDYHVLTQLVPEVVVRELNIYLPEGKNYRHTNFLTGRSLD
ncbi:hypothetical protein LCGC14_3158680 [marine sediment metagenome]|uniref:Uncharacterized protein n=1 Tax=marine sediment metagenome TaxID=412755 RepID=A0A0F8VS01_9ZZZZ